MERGILILPARVWHHRIGTRTCKSITVGVAAATRGEAIRASATFLTTPSTLAARGA